MSKSSNNGHATTDRISKRAHESVDHIAESAAKAEARIRHDADAAKVSVNGAGQKAKQRSEKALHAVSNYVEENPLTALGLAFAAGTLLSILRRPS